MKDKVTQQDLVEKIQEADNILVITSGSAKIDQLTASVGLFEVLRDLDKNPALVYSKDIPGVIKFLEPEKVIQPDAESLRDFIISFDRKKVDKFRYNQEGEQYNILLTPSRLEIIAKEDIKYRKGDFNIDLILAIGIEGKAAVDGAISEHKQLMDEIPLINIVAGRKDSAWEVACWKEEASPAVSEMVYELSGALGLDKVSKQTANALLTGIIAQTERYKTRQTKSQTMRTSAELLEMGADLQLINDNLSRSDAALVEIPEAETKEIVEQALGDANEYDTKVIKDKKKKTAGAGSRLYLKAGDADGVSYGEKATDKNKAGAEYKLDKLNIDDEGNLRIISEDDEEEAVVAEGQTATPAIAAAVDNAAQAAQPQSAITPATAPTLQQPVAPTTADQARNASIVPRDVQAPIARSAEAPPHPALGAGAAAMATQPQAAPSINEIVDQAAATPAPAVPGLNEKVNALAPTAGNNTNEYIDSLMGSQPPAAAPGQALTVDNYLAQQANNPVAQPPSAPPAGQAQVAPPLDGSAPPAPGSNPYAPPSAPPLASMT